MGATLPAAVAWRWRTFGALAPRELYAILAARQRVFVVEQRCVFLDADGRDEAAEHLLGCAGEELVAYLRLFPPGVVAREAVVGRVLVGAAARGGGLGRELVLRGIRRARELAPDAAVRIAAQRQVVPFYERLGFRAAGAPFDEDGIEHLPMLLAPAAAAPS